MPSRTTSRRVWLPVVVALIGFAAHPGLLARLQNLPPPIDRSQPPTFDVSTGGFTLRRLDAPVVPDRARWFEVPLVVGSKIASQFRPRYSVDLRFPNDQGDVRRWRVDFFEQGNAGVTLENAAAYAAVLVDEDWIILDPLDAIHVKKWRRYGLSKAFGITPYVTLRALSGDRSRLVFSRRSCPVDCPGVKDEYFELTFPKD